MIHSDTFCVGSRPHLESLNAWCGLGCASPKFGLEAALSLGEPGWSLDHTRVRDGIRTGLWQPFFLEYIIFVKSFMGYFTSSFSFLLCIMVYTFSSVVDAFWASFGLELWGFFFLLFFLKENRLGWSVGWVCFPEGSPCCTGRKIISHSSCPWLPSLKVRRDGMVQKVLWKLCCLTLPLVCDPSK